MVEIIFIFLQKVALMKYKNPVGSNKLIIATSLDETFINRRTWILESQPLTTEIFEKYPRLLDYDGEMAIISVYNLIMFFNISQN